jgi:acetyl esterase
MSERLHPTPISLGKRIVLFLIRILMGLGVLFVKLRPSPAAPGPLSRHAYGPHPSENLLYIPRKPGSPTRAPVVYIHGGGWIMGKKELYTRDLYFLADAGYPVFNLEYPLAPEHPHPGILRSLLKAFEWIRENHPDVEKVHLMGDSAGGNLVMMLGILLSNPNLIEDLGPEGNDKPTLACHSVVSLYGVLDRLTWLENGFPGARLMMECYGGKPCMEEKVDANLAITPMDLDFDEHPPSFLIAGSADPLCESTQICAQRLVTGNGTAESKIYEGEQHGFFNMSWRPAADELRQDILTFLEKHDPAGAA